MGIEQGYFDQRSTDVPAEWAATWADYEASKPDETEPTVDPTTDDNVRNTEENDG